MSVNPSQHKQCKPDIDVLLRRKNLSTIGIEGFIKGPSHALPSSYLLHSSLSSSFTSWEITGVVKQKPDDFVVREILPKNSAKISKIITHYKDKCTTNKNSDDAFLTAFMPSAPPIVLSPDHHKSRASPSKRKDAIDCEEGEQSKEKISGEQQQIPFLTTSSSGDNATANTISSESLSLSEEEIIQTYLEQVAIPELSATSLRESLEELDARIFSRIPISHDDIEEYKISTKNDVKSNGSSFTPISVTMGNNSQMMDHAEVWIPPLSLLGEDTDKIGPKTSINRSEFHRAIRIKFPFLKSSSASHNNHNGSLAPTTKDVDTTIISGSTLQQPSVNIKKNLHNKNITDSTKNTNNEHWIKVTVEDCFDGLIEYLYAPRNDLRQLYLFRNRGFEGALPSSKKNDNGAIDMIISSAVLRLRPDVSKDDRRKVHHILNLKNKHFETTVRNQGSKQDCSFKSICVTWKKQSLRKGMRKNNKRKHSHNDGEQNTLNHENNKNLFCVLKKTQKEHLTTMQILSRSLRCRQSDIGFAGIKDMKAVTYQFITLRNMEQQRVENTINRRLDKRDVELKIICSNVDFVLNVGDLEGNYFEITVRNLKRVKVDHYLLPIGESDASKAVKESFVDCDSAHIKKMVARIEKHGFINFYGEQRIGAPGSPKVVGVRGFEIGLAMLRQDFKEAVKLLMEGTRHRETDNVRRVRQAWKDSNGDPAITLKAFRGADIMPRERAVLRGLNRYPNNPLESLRFMSYNMRMFYVNAYQSYIFNKAASQRIKLNGETAIKGDIYFDKDENHRDNIKVVYCNEVPPIEITQVVLPLPGYNIQYPANEIGQLYRNLLQRDNVRFENNSIPESTAKGSYRRLIVRPGKLSADIVSSVSACKSMKLSFQLPKGSYATMLLRELMLTTVI